MMKTTNKVKKGKSTKQQKIASTTTTGGNVFPERCSIFHAHRLVCALGALMASSRSRFANDQSHEPGQRTKNQILGPTPIGWRHRIGVHMSVEPVLS
jgi:hypothetical protein